MNNPTSEPRPAKPATATYVEGWEAFSAGESSNDCPYPSASGSSAQRTEWMTGYYDHRVDALCHKMDARMEARLAERMKK